MRKVVINGKHGGFSLSEEAIELYGKLKGLNLVKIVPKTIYFNVSYWRDGIKDDEHFFNDNDLERDDPILVAVITALGEKASGPHAKLKIVEIPSDIEFTIEEYDGLEHVAEKHRTWY